MYQPCLKSHHGSYVRYKWLVIFWVYPLMALREAIELFTALEREISLSGSGMESRRLHREVQGFRFAFRSGRVGRRRCLRSSAR